MLEMKTNGVSVNARMCYTVKFQSHWFSELRGLDELHKLMKVGYGLES